MQDSSAQIQETNPLPARLLARLNPTVNAFPIQITNIRQKIIGVNAGRTKLIVQNLSASDIEIGPSDLVFGTGFKILAASTYFDDIEPFTGEWYAVSSVAGPLDVRIRDEGRNIGA